MTTLLLTAVTAFTLAADPGPAADPPPSDAERIARTRRQLDDARKELAALRQELDDPDGEYARAEAEFNRLDRELAELRREVARAGGEELPLREAELRQAQEHWQAARDRFNLAIQHRKTATEKVAVLTAQIEKGQRQLDVFEGKARPEPPPAPAPAPEPPARASEPVAPLPGLPAAPAPEPAPEPARPAEEPPEVKTARAQAEARKAALRDAEAKARSVEDRVKLLKESIEIEDRLLRTERLSADHAQQQLIQLTETLCSNPPADPAELAKLAERVRDAEERLAAGRVRIKAVTDRLAALNEDLNATRDEQVAAAALAGRKRQEAEAADRELAELLDPFHPRNLLRKFLAHGPQVVGIALGMLALHLLVRQFARQIVRLMARNGHRGSEEDRENRASTLVGVFRYAANLLIFGGGAVMLLDELGVPVVPLMGGAAVLGLAVAFGAQNLIRDYFAGFMILMEDQYGINDVVRIGTIAGIVEKITLRVTVLRDLEGVLHFVPHGGIANVSNMTHGWSRALFDLPIPHGEDVDRVMEVLRGLGKELRNDPVMGLKILDDLEMLGVDALDPSAVVVRFFIKTRPLQQWAVKREMLRRIKNRFDELGIDIPAHRREILHRFPDGRPDPAAPVLQVNGDYATR
jgi:small-conductance mechanosensitive channel/predicted  nucleic acid-binding Zn-ribbon protein